MDKIALNEPRESVCHNSVLLGRNNRHRDARAGPAYCTALLVGKPPIGEIIQKHSQIFKLHEQALP